MKRNAREITARTKRVERYIKDIINSATLIMFLGMIV